MSHKADLDLAKAILKGEETQFNVFFNEYFPRLFRFATARMENDDQELVRDIVQATMTNAVRGMDSYRGDAAMFTWLCQICRNEIAGYFRKLSRSVPEVPADDEAIRPVLEALTEDDELSPGSLYENLQTRRLIQEVLDFLPTNYGDALEWKYIYGLSVTEIAEKLSVTELAAQSILARARTAFRKAILTLSPQLAHSAGESM